MATKFLGGLNVSGELTAPTPASSDNSTKIATTAFVKAQGYLASLPSHTHGWTEITGKPSTFTPSAHTHAISEVTGLQTALDGKQAAGSYAAASHTHTISQVTGLQSALDGKQAAGSYAASIHGHAISDITGLQTALDGKQAAGSYAAASHTHTIAQVTGLQSALDGKQPAGAYLTDIPDEYLTQAEGDAIYQPLGSYAAASHTHTFASLTAKPTTLAGYGITDAASASHTHTFASLTSKPTTLSGYGITDAATAAQGTKADTAFGWGNHSGLYASASHNHDTSYLPMSYNDVDMDNYDKDMNLLLGRNLGGWSSGTKPAGSHNGFGIFQVTTHVDGYATQLGLDTNQNTLWIRSANPSTWGSWTKIWSEQHFSSTNVSNWNTAFGWGNHASAGYLTASSLSGYATQTYVNNAVAAVIDSSPDTLNTLNELAAALGDDPNFATTITNLIGTKANASHTHAISDVTGLQNALDGKAASSHTHTIAQVTGLQTALDGKQPAGSYAAASHTHGIGSITDSERWWNNFGQNHSARTAFDAQGATLLTGFGWRYVQGSGNSPGWGNTGNGQYYALSVGLGNDYASTSYAMQIAIPRLGVNPYLSLRFEENGALGAWTKISAAYADSAGSVAWDNVSGKPSTFSPSSHTHTIAQVEGLQNALDGKAASSHTHTIANVTGLQNALDGKAAASHTHTIANVTGLQAALDGKQPVGNYLTDIPDEYLTQAEADSIYQPIGSYLTGLGFSYSTGVSANHVVQRDANGYIYANYVNHSSSESENPTINTFFVSNGDGWTRKATIAHVKSQLGLGSAAYSNTSAFAAASHEHTWTSILNRPTALSQFTNDLGNYGSWITASHLNDYTNGGYRVIADYGNDTTWYMRSNGQFIWGNAHDWTQSFRLNLNHNGSENGTWAFFGQQDSNATNGRYRGVRIRKYAGGVTDGDLSAGAFYIGDTRKDVNWDTAYGWGNHAGLYAAASHTHTIANVTGLQNALDGKQAAGSYAAASHTHDRSQVSGWPSWMYNTNMIQDYAPSDVAVPSGFYQSYVGNGNPTGTWFNWINVRHSNPDNGHGYQIGMSYYDNNLWFRSYQGATNPTFQEWAYAISNQNIGSQSVNYANSAGAVSWGNVTGKPSTFTPSSHTHDYLPLTGGSLTGNLTSNSSLDFEGTAYFGGNISTGAYFSGAGFDVWSSAYIGGALSCGSSITAMGEITAYSDATLKENVETLTGAVDMVKGMRGVKYTMKETQKQSVGVIAQEMLEVLPEVVTKHEDGLHSVSYGNIVAVLIEAIKEQQAQIDELKAKLDCSCR